MVERHEIEVIGHIRTPFPEKFGIPRQSGLIGGLESKIVFEPEFRSPEAVRGLDGFSHIWVLWQFSQAVGHGWRPTVRPPWLGGNVRMGVFATRSPFRPNNIGLSCLKLERVEIEGEEGPVLYVSGADMVDGTPIYDIKPYVAHADSHPEAVSGFARGKRERQLEVEIPVRLRSILPDELVDPVTDVLANDPRPAYQDDPQREYGFLICDYEIKFKVDGTKIVVTNVEKNNIGGNDAET